MIRIAILGAGPVAERHLGALQAHPGECRVTTIYDEQPVTANAFAAGHGLMPCSELEPVWEEADAVVVCDLGARRARVIGTALARGIDVLIEPPLAMSEQELQRMLGGIVKAPRRPVAMIGHDELYHPALGAVRELLAGQTIVSLELERHDPKGAAALPDDFDIVREMLLPQIEMIGALIDQPVVATQAAGARSKPAEPFDHARALLVLDDNTLVTLSAARCGGARVRTLRAVTTGAVVECDLDTGVVEATRLADDGVVAGAHSVRRRIDVPHRDPWEAQAAAWLQAIEARAKPRLSIGAIVTAEETADAIRGRMDLVDRRTPSRRTGKLRAA